MVDRLLPMLRVGLLCLLTLAGSDAGAATKGLREADYRRLAEVQDLMERREYALALRKLEALQGRLDGEPYGRAVVLQTFGHLYTVMERYPQAIEAIRQSLALRSLPADTTRHLRLLSAQLRVQEGDYAGALADLNRWFAGASKTRSQAYASAHALAGVAHARLENIPAAIEHLRRAVDADEDPGEQPMRQLLAVHLQARQHGYAAELLQRIIHLHAGGVDDWLQLAAIYRAMNDERRAVAVLELAYRQGLLTRQEDLLHLARYFLFLHTPEKAARLLDSSLDTGALPSTRENWELLAEAWFRSKENQKALASLDVASSLQDDPGLHLMRARLAAEENDWSRVLAAASDVFRSGTPTQKGEAYLLKGFAHYRHGETDAAVRAFAQALQQRTSAARARQWLGYLGEVDR
jgi:tetratricopeptide (TPR) repeat protein